MSSASDHKPSSYRSAIGVVVHRVRSLAWIVLLPAAAECTASVWFPSVSLYGLDLQLALLNVTGALMEGFFAAWEGGAAVATGPVGRALEYLSTDMRGSFLSTYTSWAGMIGFAAALSHESGSLSSGLLYMFGCVACGVVAHAIGRAAAVFIFSAKHATGSYSAPSARETLGTTAVVCFGETPLHAALLFAVVAYIASTYVAVATGYEDFHDADVDADLDNLPALLAFLESDKNRLLVAMSASVLGAASGNVLGSYVDEQLPNALHVPRGTLVCNGLFALLGLSLNAGTLRHARWQRSVLLQSFAGSFCGAASAFAGHSSDASQIFRDNGAGLTAAAKAIKNSLANLLVAALVFLVALELEALVAMASSVDANRNGVVELVEVVAHYGLAQAPPPPCKPPIKLLGIAMGGPRC